MESLSQPEALGHLLSTLAQSHPNEIPPEALSTLARGLWYGAPPAISELRRFLETAFDDPLYKRRALYLVDVLRRFSCMSEERSTELKAIVASGAAFKPYARSTVAAERVSKFQLDALAHEWGLEEDVCQQMQHVLQFQTRHYAATQRPQRLPSSMHR